MGTAIMIQKDAVRRTSIKLLRPKKFLLTKLTMTIRMIRALLRTKLPTFWGVIMPRADV